MDDYYYQMIYNLALVKKCYDYDKERTLEVFGKMHLDDEHTEYFLPECFHVISSNVRFFSNEHIRNHMSGEMYVEIMVLKHPIIAKTYALHDELRRRKRFKYASKLSGYIKSAYKQLKYFTECYEGAVFELRKDKNGIVNRFYFVKHGYCMDFDGALIFLMNYITIMKEGYFTISNLLYDRGVNI